MGKQGGSRFIDAAVALFRPFGAQFREVAGQFDVLAHRQKRQQVELLEDVASVIDTKVIAGAGRQFR
ncbi:hypothetical protein D3C75_1266000 [compost metagenome]